MATLERKIDPLLSQQLGESRSNTCAQTKRSTAHDNIEHNGVMLLHLDSHDLINVFKETSISPKELKACLIERNTKLVYSPETIQEVVTPGDLEESRRRLKLLTTLPKTYIRREQEVLRGEFRCAIEAVRNQKLKSIKTIQPFVSTWQLVDVTAAPVLEDQFMDRLVEIIMPLLRAQPDRFRNTPELKDAFMANVAYDRREENIVGRGSRKVFHDAIGATLISLGLHPPQPTWSLVDELADWMFDNPAICPSWRLLLEAYAEFQVNVRDQGQLGDNPDFAHLSITPYVDAITLDRRMAGYCRTASHRLARIGGLDYSPRVFRNLEAWLNRST
ncbi:MAG: hypothetical protein ACREA9_15790 [Pyrinomonadaceae bacterium]